MASAAALALRVRRLFIELNTTVLSLKLVTGSDTLPVVFNTLITILPDTRGRFTGVNIPFTISSSLNKAPGYTLVSFVLTSIPIKRGPANCLAICIGVDLQMRALLD